VLPMIVPAAEDEPLLCPYDLSADIKALTTQAFSNGRGVQRPVPDVGYVATEVRPRRLPVGLNVIADLCPSYRFVET
jgi:hypothetical protein